MPANYYDMNLAIASDYLRARWETLKWGGAVTTAKVEGYVTLKKFGLISPQGPGPVSPYTALEHKFMLLGVGDQVKRGGQNVGVYWNQIEEKLKSLIGHH